MPPQIKTGDSLEVRLKVVVTHTPDPFEEWIVVDGALAGHVRSIELDEGDRIMAYGELREQVSTDHLGIQRTAYILHATHLAKDTFDE